MTNGKKQNSKRPLREEFQAYNQYGYSYSHQEQPADGAKEERTAAKPVQKPARKARRKSNLFFRAFVLLSILSVGLVVVLQTVFRLEAVCVIGHETRTARDIINVSGLAYGQNVFTIDPDEVRSTIEKDHTLILKDIQIKYPNLVYLQVKERYPVALMQWLGVHYVLDKDGLVMDESSGTELIGTMPLVTGFRVSNAHKGQFLTVKSQLQLEAYTELIVELNKQKYASHVTEIRLNNPENIYMVTADGISVRLGRPTDLKRKIQAVRTAEAYLRALDEHAGVLDVNEPTDVKYRPDN